MEKNYGELIPNRIFIGGVDAIDNLLAKEKIDIIYDLRAEVNSALPSEKSIHQPIVDDAEQQDDSILAAVKKVIDAYNQGKNIYFHCNTGRGRAGTIATATLLELSLANSIEEAEEMAKEARSNINIKPQFKDALKRIYGE
ncbi:dual specificity protein phosphatase family protein [Sporosarcina sp. JAI121]|uniref:protein-tyrosine phosphatase family protein n=1 Tax=Sporosarcina sp. JAI121 TaxID=2723064 RepID=UPI0017D44FCD|nr:protein-tyrosine phosphatase [Sporosarcina sp. JAI121]